MSAWLAVAAAPAVADAPRPASAAEIAELVRGAGDAAKYDNASVVTLLDEADVYVEANGVATTHACRVIKVLSRAGVQQQSVQRFEFDPQSNRVAIVSIAVHDKDGNRRELAMDDAITQPAPQNLIFWGNEQHVVGVPGLEVGDAIEIRTRRTGYNVAYLASDRVAGAGQGAAHPEYGDSGSAGLIPPMPGHWYEVVQFPDRHPIVRKRYSVHLPESMPVQFEVYNGAVRSSLWFEGEHRVYTFSAEDLPALKREPHAVAASDTATKVVLATVPDWPSKSRWFHEANRDQFEADPAIREMVESLTAGLSDPDEKIEACLRWVANNIRYCGTTRGPREGYTVHRSIETFRDRAGVCKDKAGMLVTMLRVLGHDAFPAMTMAGSRIEAIPADQFNHCVTVIREADGSFRLLDPTWVPLSREWWSSREAQQGIVYGTPEGEPLTLTPYYEPAYNRYVCRSAGRIDETGALHTRLEMEMSGYADSTYRRSFNRPEPQRAAALAAALNIAPNLQVEEYQATAPLDLAHDARVQVQVSAEDYAAGSSGRRLLRLPLMSHPLKDWLLADLFYDLGEGERRSAVRLRATRRVEYHETLELPDGWEVTDPPGEVSFDSAAASIQFTPQVEPGRLSYRFTLDLKQHIVEPADYAGLKKALDEMNTITRRWIVCSTPAGADGSHAAR